MGMKMPGVRIIIAACAVIAGAAVGAMGAESASADGPSNAKRPPVYAHNAEGLSYGSELEVTDPAQRPDLIAAWATNGKRGYVKKVDLDDPQPANPQEALAMAAKNAGKTRTVNVYESDGKTIIGVFVLHYGTGGLTAKPDTAQ